MMDGRSVSIEDPGIVQKQADELVAHVVGAPRQVPEVK